MIDQMQQLLGMHVRVTSALPLLPTPGQDARRIVRHGMTEILEWLGEDVGPEPGAPTHVLVIDGVLQCSPEFAARIRATEHHVA